MFLKHLRMKSLTRLLIIFSIIGINCHHILAQVPVVQINRNLNQAGYENVRLSAKSKTLLVSYENNIYRDKVAGLSAVIDLLSACGYDSIKVITLVNDLPMIVTNYENQDRKANKGGIIPGIEASPKFTISYHTDQIWKSLRNIKPQDSHVNKFDLVFYPQFSVMNVLFHQFYEVELNIAPALEVSLWRGMKFTGQIIFPLATHFLYGSESYLVRMGFLTIAQEFRLPGAVLGRGVVGNFNNNRYGADISLTKYLFGGRAYLKVNGGYTGLYQYQDATGWYRDDMKTLTGFLKGGYFYKRLNLQFDGSAGRYLNGDYGIRGDCTRYWGETAIGLWVSKGSSTINGGFHFTIPIGTRKFKKNRTFQMRAPSYFDWEYNGGTDFYGGQIYKTQPNENRVEQFYSPNLVINNLLK